MMTSNTNNAPQSAMSFWRRLRHTPLRDLVMRRQLTGRMDVEAILSSYALPAACADVVRAVVKKSRLWRLEKAEVAKELAAHFRDGLDAGRDEAGLVKQFGDPTKTAKLIRRAKVRCRPMLWHLAPGALRAVAVFVLLYFLLVGYYALGKPEIKVNYLKELNAAAEKVAPEDRAWPLYREAAMRLGLDDNPKSDSPANRLLLAISENQPLSNELQVWLKQNTAALELIRRGAAKPGLGYVCRFGNGPEDLPGKVRETSRSPDAIVADPYASDHPLYTVQPVAYLIIVRHFAQLLVADARIACAEGDVSRVYANLGAIDGLENHCYETPTLIANSTGQSINRMQLRLVSEWITQHPEQLNDHDLEQLAHRLARRQFREITRRSFAGQKYYFDDLIQRLYTDDGQGNGHFTKSGWETLVNPDFGLPDPIGKFAQKSDSSRSNEDQYIRDLSR